MKRLSGGKASSGDLLNHMNFKEVENLSTHKLANSIKKAFLEPLEEYRLSYATTRLALELPRSIQGTCMESIIKLNPSKSCGP